jgi:hypothetical protein
MEVENNFWKEVLGSPGQQASRSGLYLPYEQLLTHHDQEMEEGTSERGLGCIK